jgi:hypothetical protein
MTTCLPISLNQTYLNTLYISVIMHYRSFVDGEFWQLPLFMQGELCSTGCFHEGIELRSHHTKPSIRDSQFGRLVHALRWPRGCIVHGVFSPLQETSGARWASSWGPVYCPQSVLLSSLYNSAWWGRQESNDLLPASPLFWAIFFLCHYLFIVVMHYVLEWHICNHWQLTFGVNYYSASVSRCRGNF